MKSWQPHLGESKQTELEEKQENRGTEWVTLQSEGISPPCPLLQHVTTPTPKLFFFISFSHPQTCMLYFSVTWMQCFRLITNRLRFTFIIIYEPDTLFVTFLMCLLWKGWNHIFSSVAPISRWNCMQLARQDVARTKWKSLANHIKINFLLLFCVCVFLKFMFPPSPPLLYPLIFCNLDILRKVKIKKNNEKNNERKSWILQ